MILLEIQNSNKKLIRHTATRKFSTSNMLLRLFHKTPQHVKNALILYAPAPVPAVLPNPVHSLPCDLVNILKTHARPKVVKLLPVHTTLPSRDSPVSALK